MKKVTENYLEGEQRVCDVWAQYINSSNMTMEEAVEYIPLDRIVVETDCPYMAPVPHRGKRNSSLYLPHVVQAIADLKQTDSKTVEEQTALNAKRIFRLEEN